ncbi:MULTISPECIES: histidine kinase [unclassified Motilimonas]|uniref:histidine kinase n=1 Tax=Motilimonas TaxID=1914248 RepID=UPI001E61EB78|nr:MULTISPECIES: histidine kinase [unclassified Motilimonas]MCE0558022.1 histidine kinase [Motilimonas sp. E26]MDO6526027.1 histidine kinase [Motilimonas sp. 1_MG-2023]
MQQPEELETVIHDARKPLNHISMHAELIKLMADQSASETDLKQAADQIIKAAKECSAILQTLVK